MGFSVPSLPTTDTLEKSLLDDGPEADGTDVVMQRVVAAECMRILRRACETAVTERWGGESHQASSPS